VTQAWVARVAAEVGIVLEHPRRTLCATQRATLVRGSSVTAHCHAATARPTREYQVDHRRQSLTSTASRATWLRRSRRYPIRSPH